MDIGLLDQGMDGLAKALGLDIEAIAINLALKDDVAPTQCHPVQGLLQSKKSSPCAPLKEAQVILPAKKNQSPIINPVFIRHSPPASHASASNDSSLIKNNAEVTQKPEVSKDVQNSFMNLFGGSSSCFEKIQQTPSFQNRGNRVQPKKTNSVFSPIFEKPQSEASILGIRGDYVPNSIFTPVQTGKIVKNPALAIQR